tara:strand:+ start:2847 stop:3731 length:885 start_codon:yes stop_codon:yes gene_type:complete
MVKSMGKKVVVMTGATSGFGVDWFQALSKNIDADFYILARNQDKFQSLVAASPRDIQNNIHFVPCELSSLKGIADAVSSVKGRVSSVDILINNAGIFPSDLPSLNDDNIELTFVVNHLAPLLTTLLLEEELNRSESARVINTSSFQHFNANLNLADINFSNTDSNNTGYSAMLAYQNSKLCNVLSTRHLSTLLGKNISVNCFDPGIVDTDMTKDAIPKILSWAYPLLRVFFRDGIKGAETGVYLSIDETANNNTGGYYRDKRLKQPSAIAQSQTIAEQLHQISIKLIEPYLGSG